MASDWKAFAVFVMGASLALAASPRALADAAQDAARDRLAGAFDRTFQPPGVRRIDLRVIRNGRQVARRGFEIAYRREGEGARSLVRFVEPDYLRGHALLIVDHGGGTPPDTWLYQAEDRRPRRIGTTQRSDSFYGSDLTFEDLERPAWERWRVREIGAAEEAGLACALFDAWPPTESQYGRLRVWLATPPEGVARIDFFGRAGADPEAGAEPIKRLRVALDGVEEEQGFLRVPRVEIDAVGRAARTTLAVERISIDPAIAASVFSASGLEREGDDLFGLADRHDRGAP